MTVEWKKIQWNDIMNLTGLQCFKPSPLKTTITVEDDELIKEGIICIFSTPPQHNIHEFLNIDSICYEKDSWIMCGHYFKRKNMEGLWKLDAPCRYSFDMDFDKDNDLDFDIAYYYLRNKYKYDYICGPLNFINLRKPNLE
jgi:hypothetical protein